MIIVITDATLDGLDQTVQSVLSEVLVNTDGASIGHLNAYATVDTRG